MNGKCQANKDKMSTEYNKIPKKYAKLKIGRISQVSDKDYGTIDVLITKYKKCTKCNCLLTRGKEKECTRCGSKKLKLTYWISECENRRNNCFINRWGCEIHFKGNDPHPPTCCCDQFY